MNANAAELAHAGVQSRRAGPLQTLAWCARREIWEHRSLWIAPLAVDGALAVLFLLGPIRLDVPFHEGVMPPPLRVAAFTIGQWILAQPLFLTAAICVGFYLLDALYAERKDRSILFWKSLPVSDELTVASKFVVAAAVVPIGAFLAATVGDLVFAAIATVRIPGVISWNTREWARTELVLLLEVVLAVLWYAPIGGALLLLSSWVRKGPILWATLVPIVAPIVELVAFRTHYIARFEHYRVQGIWEKLGQGQEKLFSNPSDPHALGDVLGKLDISGAFTDLDLWIGVIATIAMLYAAARVRRYRDDT